MPMIAPAETLELKATGEKTNLFGYSSSRYEIRQRGEIMEIWATDQLLPFQAYLPAQPPVASPPLLAHQWPAVLSARNLFPLSAVLRMEGGTERFRFEVQAVTPRKLNQKELEGFRPPEGYVEIVPRLF